MNTLTFPLTNLLLGPSELELSGNLLEYKYQWEPGASGVFFKNWTILCSLSDIIVVLQDMKTVKIFPFSKITKEINILHNMESIKKKRPYKQWLYKK
jgi:hypothetical protein